MDILDIDEALKDDSFIFLEDKTHDDVSNILQQWKSNNCMQQQQLQQEQAHKLNSRTFTRPKRKLAQNLESQFFNTSQYTQQQQQQCNGTPMLNVEIGGLVTNMQKSFLQDTSPPPSICSSMDVSIDRMNNSLITSADFINVNFLQSANALDFAHESMGGGFNFNNKATMDGYTLSDMIRDRKNLESLTLSGDGTLIKDCNIAQIDDISITLCKTASGCSTMDNSTESVEANNRTVEIPRNRNYGDDLHKNEGGGDVVLHTMLQNEEMIGETTFNLVENSMYSDKQPEIDTPAEGMLLNITQNMQTGPKTFNETFKKPMLLDETICISGKGGNTTFDCQHHTPEARCETPEGVNKTTAAMKFYESTPQTTTLRYNGKQQYTPSIKNVDDVNISPIVAPNTPMAAARVLDETFERDLKLKFIENKITSETFTGPLPEELLEDVPNPNGTFNKSLQRLQRSEANAAMQNVMDLAQAEAELLVGGENEEEFEHMLDEFSRVELNAEQLKMKKSLDSIKKRFTYGLTEKHERELSREAKDMREMLQNSAEEQLCELENEDFVVREANTTMEMRGNELRKLRDSMKETARDNMKKANSPHSSNSSHGHDAKETILNSKEFMKELRDSSSVGLTSSSLSGTSGSSSGGEPQRLLSRRSRLYDDINLSKVSLQSKSPDSSYTVHKKDDNLDEEKVTQVTADTTAESAEEKTEVCNGQVGFTSENIVESNSDSKTAPEGIDKNSRRLAEKRERDRDRFKTIKIVKTRTADGEEESGERLNVPCIDDMVVDEPATENTDVSTEMVPPHSQRFSRRDQNSPPSNDVSVVNPQEQTEERTQRNANYLTYKKPREKLIRRNLPEIISAEDNTPCSIDSGLAAPQATIRSEVRSLSRPRYISGLQKFTVVSKATSAGDLEKTSAITAPSRQLNLTLNSTEKNSAKVNDSSSSFNRTQPYVGAADAAKELKSPMGIKSKSFHNLSSNIGGSGSTQKLSSYGMKKNMYTAGILTEKQAKANTVRSTQSPNRNRSAVNTVPQEKIDETIFKVPKLVSGIRAPSAGGVKRAGLVRPSSGYYSLNMPALANPKSATQTVDIDFDDDRHSPTDSMSSASSRNSVQSNGIGLKPLNGLPSTLVPDCQQTPATLGKASTTSIGTGIPKPSGLRPPTNIKRSGLPRPASIVRR